MIRDFFERLYNKIADAFKMYIPGNKTYHTIQARRARTGTRFILPFIIGFLVFMVKPLIVSLQMSFTINTRKPIMKGRMNRVPVLARLAWIV